MTCFTFNIFLSKEWDGCQYLIIFLFHVWHYKVATDKNHCGKDMNATPICHSVHNGLLLFHGPWLYVTTPDHPSTPLSTFKPWLPYLHYVSLSSSTIPNQLYPSRGPSAVRLCIVAFAAREHGSARGQLEGLQSQRRRPQQGEGQPPPQELRRLCGVAPLLPERPQPELQGAAAGGLQPGPPEQRSYLHC